MSKLDGMSEKELRAELDRMARNCCAVGARVIAYQQMQNKSMAVLDRLLKHAKEFGSISFEELKPIMLEYSVFMDKAMQNLPALEVPEDEMDV